MDAKTFKEENLMIHATSDGDGMGRYYKEEAIEKLLEKLEEKESFIKEFLYGDPVCPECTEPALVAMGWHCRSCGYNS